MTVDVTRFCKAILREPTRNAVDGLRAVDRGAPDIDVLIEEHAAYRAALEDLGVATTVLPALDAYPDSVFVEDPALVYPEAAIQLRPGAPTRLGEAAEIAPFLEKTFPRLIRLQDGFADGGDVLNTADAVVIGLSDRTDRTGAEALAEILETLGRPARIVTPPPGVLHFKTACSLVGPETVLATAELLAGGDYFDGLDLIEVAPGEDPAANALAVNGTVLLAAGFPETEARLRDRGVAVRTVKLDEVMKLDAGLSCMSLRWNAE